MSRQIDCAICLEPLTRDNKVLPCQHTYHTACLWELYAMAGSTNISCPECREDHLIREFEKLRPNMWLNQMLDQGETSSSKIPPKKKFIKLPEHTLTHTFGDIRNMKVDVPRYSSSTMEVRGIPWKIGIQRFDDSFTVFADCNSGDVGEWSCQATFTVKLIPMKIGVKEITYSSTNDFKNTVFSRGFPLKTVLWSDVIDIKKGYMNANGEITCQITVDMGEFIREDKKEIPHTLTEYFNIKDLKEGNKDGNSIKQIHGIEWKISITKSDGSLGMYASCHEKGDNKWSCKAAREFRLLPQIDGVGSVIDIGAEKEYNNTDNSWGVDIISLSDVMDINKGYLNGSGEICCRVKVTAKPPVFG